MPTIRHDKRIQAVLPLYFCIIPYHCGIVKRNKNICLHYFASVTCYSCCQEGFQAFLAIFLLRGSEMYHDLANKAICCSTIIFNMVKIAQKTERLQAFMFSALFLCREPRHQAAPSLGTKEYCFAHGQAGLIPAVPTTFDTKPYRYCKYF